MDIDLTTLTEDQLNALSRAVADEQIKRGGGRDGGGAHTNGPPVIGPGGPPPHP